MTGFERKSVWDWQQQGVLLVEDGNHGENRPRKDEFTDVGMAFIRAADMNDGAILFDSAEKIDERGQARVRKGIGKPGDILISHKGTIGRVGRAPLDCPPFVCSPQTTFWRVEDATRLDRGYLFALLRSPSFQAEFEVRSGETDMAGYVSLTSQRALEITLPPIEIQREIAAVVGVLDDKIELNRKTAATLEEMARTLYRSWFVNFDPVHSKSEGRAPAHMDESTSSLFPTSFNEDGLPDGWNMEPLSKHVSVLRGLSYKGAGLCDEADGIPLHNLNSVFEGGGYKMAGIKYYRGDFRPRHQITPGELIATNTEQGFDLLLMGHAALVPHYFGPIGLFSQHIYKLDPKKGSPLSRQWLYLMLSVSPKGQEIRSYANGTTVNMLPMDALEIPEICVPPHDVVQAFDAVVELMFARKESIEVENQTLASLRDTLLPRLMSGELRVGEAQEQVKEIAG
jgi:type I restriction enzyme S subunit